MEEKRRYHRLEVQLPASFKVLSGSGESSATVLNIGGTGMCLLSQEALKSGESVDVNVSMPSGEHLTIHTKVIWSKEQRGEGEKGYKAGLQILDEMKSDEAKFVKFYANKLLNVAKEKKN